MRTVPVPVIGPTGGHRSTQFSAEATHNMYLDEVGGRFGMHDFPGLKTLGSQGGADRGAHVMSGVLYRVCGRNLYKVASDGTHTLLGAVAGTTERCVFADDGSNLFFTVAGGLYQYVSGTISAVSQSVVPHPSWVTYINRQFVIGGGNSGVFATSDVADGSSYNALNFAEAEVQPDAVVVGFAYSQIIYMFGETSTELWYNSGIGNPPFDRQDTSLVNVGIAGKSAVAKTDSYLYWLGDDRKFYQCAGASARSISTVPVANLVEGFADVSDCVASSFVINGLDMVVFQFPSADRTLVFSEKYTNWVTIGSSSSYPGSRWYGNQVVRCYEKNLAVGDGAVYEIDTATYEDGGDTRLRVRTLPSISGAMIQTDQQITVGRLRVNMQCGVGLATGQGSDPVIMCQWSNDGGHTWGAESQVSIGVAGDYTIPVDFFQFTTGYDIRARIQCSDPVFLSVFDGFVELRPAGY